MFVRKIYIIQTRLFGLQKYSFLSLRHMIDDMVQIVI